MFSVAALTLNHSYWTAGFPLAWQRRVALYPLTTRSAAGALVIVGGSKPCITSSNTSNHHLIYAHYTANTVLTTNREFHCRLGALRSTIFSCCKHICLQLLVRVIILIARWRHSILQKIFFETRSLVVGHFASEGKALIRRNECIQLIACIR